MKKLFLFLIVFLFFSSVFADFDYNRTDCESNNYTWFSNEVSFIHEGNYDVGVEPHSITSGDVDNDGDFDVINTNIDSNSFNVSLNNGLGVFNVINSYSVGSGPEGVVLADFNKDNNLDVAIGNGGDDDISILMGYGNGSFTNRTDYGASPYLNWPMNLDAGDLNNDGYTDIVSTSRGAHDGVIVFINDGDGTFATGIIYYTNEGTGNLALGDLDSDNYLDIAVCKYDESQVGVLLNDGDGTFATEANYNTWGTADISTAIALSDVEKDGDLDIITAARGNNDAITVLLNDGSGSYSRATEYYTSSSTDDIASGDFNGDGYDDFVVDDSAGFLVFLNDGDGTFTLNKTKECSETPHDFSLNYFDNDGDLDIVTANINENSFSVYLNQGLKGENSPCCGDDYSSSTYWDDFYNSTHVCWHDTLSTNQDLNKGLCEINGNNWLITNNLTYSYSNIGSDGIWTMIAGDVDNDGDPDVYTAGNNFDSAIWINDGTGTFTINSSVGEDRGAIAAFGDINGDGNLDILHGQDSNGDKLIKIFGNGNGTFQQPVTVYNFGTSVNGIEIVDYDLDGDLDALIVDHNDCVFNATNDGSGNFNILRIDCMYRTGFKTGDFDNNGAQDFTLGDSNLTGWYLYKYMNDGNGVYTKSFVKETSGTFDVRTGDLDDDGDVDILLFERDQSADRHRVFKLINTDGSGSFSTPIIINQLNAQTNEIQAVDVDGDGDTDLITSTYDDLFKHVNLGIENSSSYSPCCGDDGLDDDFGNYTHVCSDGILTETDLDTLPYYCEDKDYTWFTGSLTGSNGACCGDDGASDDFYNSSLACVDGSISEDSDSWQDFCLSKGYNWLTGSLTGSNGACCGDDYYNDVFYNTTHMCSYGGLIYDADNTYTQDWYGDNINYSSGKGVCELKSHTWFSNIIDYSNYYSYGAGNSPEGVAVGDLDGDGDLDVLNVNADTDNMCIHFSSGLTGSNGACCGDDGSSDDFSNSTMFCVSGSPVSDGDLSESACLSINSSNTWFTGDVNGDNPPCCGDDGLSDFFGNSSACCDRGFFNSSGPCGFSPAGCLDYHIDLNNDYLWSSYPSDDCGLSNCTDYSAIDEEVDYVWDGYCWNGALNDSCISSSLPPFNTSFSVTVRGNLSMIGSEAPVVGEEVSITVGGTEYSDITDSYGGWEIIVDYWETNCASSNTVSAVFVNGSKTYTVSEDFTALVS